MSARRTGVRGSGRSRIRLKKLTPPVIDYLVTDADTVDYLYEKEFPEEGEFPEERLPQG